MGQPFEPESHEEPAVDDPRWAHTLKMLHRQQRRDRITQSRQRERCNDRIAQAILNHSDRLLSMQQINDLPDDLRLEAWRFIKLHGCRPPSLTFLAKWSRKQRGAPTRLRNVAHGLQSLRSLIIAQLDRIGARMSDLDVALGQRVGTVARWLQDEELVRPIEKLLFMCGLGVVARAPTNYMPLFKNPAAKERLFARKDRGVKALGLRLPETTHEELEEFREELVGQYLAKHPQAARPQSAPRPQASAPQGPAPGAETAAPGAGTHSPQGPDPEDGQSPATD